MFKKLVLLVLTLGIFNFANAQKESDHSIQVKEGEILKSEASICSQREPLVCKISLEYYWTQECPGNVNPGDSFAKWRWAGFSITVEGVVSSTKSIIYQNTHDFGTCDYKSILNKSLSSTDEYKKAKALSAQLKSDHVCDSVVDQTELD